MNTALLSIADTPLLPAVLRQARPIPAGTRICDVVPVDTPAVAVRVEGAWILRAQWGHALQPGQHLEVHHLPAGNDARKALRTILTIAAIVAAPQIAGSLLLSTGAALGSYTTYLALTTAALLTAVNVLLPIKPPELGGLAENGSPVYNTALSGNQAALNGPIPVIYGRMRLFPPFAAQPYQVYDNTSGDQFYHALLCVGMGQHTIESLQLDDTALDHFDEVEYAVLAPGEAPALVLPNVVTAAEVADVEINAGRSTPAIAACRGGLTADSIGIDIVFPGGLGDATGSSVTDYSVSIRVDWRPVDNWGVATAAWSTLATETITENLTSPVRRSYSYTLPSAARPEIRLVRVTPRDDDPLVRNDAYWTGLRAYLSAAAPLAAGATHVELRMRATEQLNGLTQRRIAVIARRLLHTWSAADGWSAEPAFTRNPAWAIVDKLRDTTYGNALPDSRIDLDTFAALAAVWDARQDRLDIVFDSVADSDEADQIMARAGRARCIWRNGVRTIVRDEAQDMPVAVYTPRDIVPGSVSLSYGSDASRVPDGIVLEYLSHQTWDWESVTCPAPGVATPTRAEYLRLPGITGATQAEREGLYEAAARALRRKTASITTELQGLLPAYGSAVVMGLPLRGWGASGEVVSHDAATGILQTTEPCDFSGGGTRYVTLQRPDGSVSDSVTVTAGADAYHLVLASALDFTPSTDDARRERTRYVFGTLTEHRRTMLVLGIRPQEMSDDGAVLVQVTAINDADAIHTADNALLPVGDEEQDPIDSPNEDAPPGDVTVAYLTSRTVSDDRPAGGGEYGTLLRLKTDGVLQFVKTYTGPGQTTTIANQWVIGAPVDPADTAAFEVRATLVSGALTSGTTGSWLAMDTQREWYASGTSDDSSSYATLRLEIRDSGGLVQASATITIGGMAAGFGE